MKGEEASGCVCIGERFQVTNYNMELWHVCVCQVTVFEQEHFQGKCQELTSECRNIQERGFDNIRSIRVESGA